MTYKVVSDGDTGKELYCIIMMIEDKKKVEETMVTSKVVVNVKYRIKVKAIANSFSIHL